MFLKKMTIAKWAMATLVAASTLVGQSESASALELFEEIELLEMDSVSLLNEDSGIDIGGWLQYGYRGNQPPIIPGVGSPNLNFNDNFSQFGSRQNHGINQAWLYAEKVADGSDGFDWGFRLDAMYGLDADDTQAFGASQSWDTRNNWAKGIYGFAMPQAYVEVASGDWSVKAGHFYTLVGYEVVTAPDNFFFSHAYTMFNAEPFTHSGAVATYNASENVTLYGGWTAGWDTGFDRYDNGSNFLGGASVGLGENVTATYITTFGDLGWRGEGYSHSIVLDVALTEDLNYVFHSDLVETNGAGGTIGFGPGGDHIFSINQYLFYTINEKLSAGLRAEMFKFGGTALTGGAAGTTTIYALTAGVNVKPLVETDCCGNVTGDWLIIRPEVRHDWSADSNVFAGQSLNYTTFAMDVILTF